MMKAALKSLQLFIGITWDLDKNSASPYLAAAAAKSLQSCPLCVTP